MAVVATAQDARRMVPQLMWQHLQLLGFEAVVNEGAMETGGRRRRVVPGPRMFKQSNETGLIAVLHFVLCHIDASHEKRFRGCFPPYDSSSKRQFRAIAHELIQGLGERGIVPRVLCRSSLLNAASGDRLYELLLHLCCHASALVASRASRPAAASASRGTSGAGEGEGEGEDEGSKSRSTRHPSEHNPIVSKPRPVAPVEGTDKVTLRKELARHVVALQARAVVEAGTFRQRARAILRVQQHWQETADDLARQYNAALDERNAWRTKARQWREEGGVDETAFSPQAAVKRSETLPKLRKAWHTLAGIADGAEFRAGEQRMNDFEARHRQDLAHRVDGAALQRHLAVAPDNEEDVPFLSSLRSVCLQERPPPAASSHRSRNSSISASASASASGSGSASGSISTHAAPTAQASTSVDLVALVREWGTQARRLCTDLLAARHRHHTHGSTAPPSTAATPPASHGAATFAAFDAWLPHIEAAVDQLSDRAASSTSLLQEINDTLPSLQQSIQRLTAQAVAATDATPASVTPGSSRPTAAASATSSMLARPTPAGMYAPLALTATATTTATATATATSQPTGAAPAAAVPDSTPGGRHAVAAASGIMTAARTRTSRSRTTSRLQGHGHRPTEPASQHATVARALQF